MKLQRSLALTSSLVLIVALAAFWNSVRSDEDKAVHKAVPTVQYQAERRHPEEPPLALPAPSPEARTKANATPADEADVPLPTVEPESLPSQGGEAVIRGRFVFEDGSPAEGVSWRLNGWEANDERVRRHGRPKDWKDLGGKARADGTFQTSFVPPRAYQFVFEAAHESVGGASWRWGEIAHGETKNLGDIVLPRAGTVEGRIVDDRGNPLSGQRFHVMGDVGRSDRRTGRDTMTVHAQSDAEGHYRLVDVPPGTVIVTASSDLVDHFGATADVRAGEVSQLDLVYRGPRPDTRIVIRASARPFIDFATPPREFVLEGNGLILTKRMDTHSGSSGSFDDVPPGVYTLRLDSPAYMPWSQADVRPGQKVKAKLQGSGALAFDVRALESGASIENFSVKVDCLNVSFQPNVFDLHDGSAPLPGGVYQGMFPGDYLVTVAAEGFPPRAVEVLGLVAGEQREVVVRLGMTTLIEGRLDLTSGQVPGEREVLLLAAAEEGDSPLRARPKTIKPAGRQ